MPTALPALDNPIAADHSASMVVDVPFGIRSGYPEFGPPFCPEAQVLATADGHPRAVGYLSRAPAPTIAGIKNIAFYSGLMDAQRAAPISPPDRRSAPQRPPDRCGLGAGRAAVRARRTGGRPLPGPDRVPARLPGRRNHRLRVRASPGNYSAWRLASCSGAGGSVPRPTRHHDSTAYRAVGGLRRARDGPFGPLPAPLYADRLIHG